MVTFLQSCNLTEFGHNEKHCYGLTEVTTRSWELEEKKERILPHSLLNNYQLNYNLLPKDTTVPPFSFLLAHKTEVHKFTGQSSPTYSESNSLFHFLHLLLWLTGFSTRVSFIGSSSYISRNAYFTGLLYYRSKGTTAKPYISASLE